LTRAEATDGPPPLPRNSRGESVQLAFRRWQRGPVVPVTMAAIAALIVGVLVGRVTAPVVDDDAIGVVGREIVTLAVDADAIWTSGRADLPAVGDQLQQLRATGEASAVVPHVEGWLESYDTVLRRLVGVDVAPTARPVQRQFVGAIALARDAVEVLATAAETEDDAARRDLTSEVVRLRIRAEELTQSARGSLLDLDGTGSSGVAEPRRLPSHAELR
jgi:hypothetical protein